MSDIFREVEEEIRHEEYKKLWDKYGPYVIVVAIFIAIGTLGYQLWHSYTLNQRRAQSDRYFAVAELAAQGQAPAELAEAWRALAEDSQDGYRVLARFQQAAALVKAGEIEAAVAVYDRIASDGGADDILLGLARIKAAQALLDIASASDIKARVASLMGDDNPWRFSAREAVAVSAFRAGDLDTARSEFERLVLDARTPPSLRARATEMIDVLGPPPGQEAAASEALAPPASPPAGDATAPAAPAFPSAPAAQE